MAETSSKLELSGVDVVTNRQVSVRFDFAAKATVIVFLSARCPCSSSHEIALKELSKEFSPLGFNFVGIHSNRDESLEFTKAHFEKSKLPFPILQDNDSKIANDWGALKTPHVFVVSPKGELLYQGGVDDSKDHTNVKNRYLFVALVDLQAGKKPEVPLTRTLGCAIKR